MQDLSRSTAPLFIKWVPAGPVVLHFVRQGYFKDAVASPCSVHSARYLVYSQISDTQFRRLFTHSLPVHPTVGQFCSCFAGSTTRMLYGHMTCCRISCGLRHGLIYFLA